MKKICPNCGAETEGKFCPDCGTNLADVVAQEEPLNVTVSEESVSIQAESAGNGFEEKVVPESLEANFDKVSSVTETPAVSGTEKVAEETVSSSEISAQSAKQKKIPKKLTGIIIAVVLVAAAAVAAMMFMGSGSHFISKACEAGTAEQKIGALTYSMPAAWKIDDTYSNPNAFFDTQRYLVKGDDGTDAVDCYVKYCGESRYYGNTLEDYASKISADEVVSSDNLTLTGAEGKHICTSFTDTDGITNYSDFYLVEADGSIFIFEFDTNDSSHDQKGMDTIVNTAQFGSYESPVADAIVGNGKYVGTANDIMRELICTIKKNNDTEGLGCGEFTYEEGATKGGSLCYSIKENDYDTGVAISFYTDKKQEHAVKSFDEVPTSIAVATSMASLLDYEDTNIALINGTFVEITGDVKYKQAYSKYVNGVRESTGYESLKWYTNSFSLNDFDYDLSVSTKSGECGVFMDVQ